MWQRWRSRHSIRNRWKPHAMQTSRLHLLWNRSCLSKFYVVGKRKFRAFFVWPWPWLSYITLTRFLSRCYRRPKMNFLRKAFFPTVIVLETHMYWQQNYNQAILRKSGKLLVIGYGLSEHTDSITWRPTECFVSLKIRMSLVTRRTIKTPKCLLFHIIHWIDWWTIKHL